MYHKKLIRELCNNEDVALKIKSLLFKIDDLKNDNENGDFKPLCNINGICEAIDSQIHKKDGYTSSCYYCGAELEVYKGNYYHYSGFFLKDFYENYKSYQTHNNYGVCSGPRTEQEKEIEDIYLEIKNLKKSFNVS